MQAGRADRLVVLTAGCGMFLSSLDTGIVNIALPTWVRTFHSSIATMTWTITLYTLALVGTVMIFGRLGDRYGRVTVYGAGLLVFLAASALCGLSGSPGTLIAFRALQGIGAAMLQGTATAIITTAIPKERQGPAFGLLAVLLGLGPVLGPGIGGLILSAGSWRWLFWINIPVAAAGLWGCSCLRKSVNGPKNAVPMNLPGHLLLSASVLSLLQGLAMASRSGMLSTATWGPLVLFAVLFALFVCREMRTSRPIVDLKLFLRIGFTAPVLGIFVLGGATSLGFILPPYFLEQARHLDSWQAGLVNLSGPLGLVLVARSSGRLMERAGTVRPMMAGLVAMAAAYGALGTMQADWQPWGMAALLGLYGIGAGLFLPSNTAAMMSAAGRDIQGTMGAIQRMVQNLGIACYTAIAAAIITAHSRSGIDTFVGGLREAWLFAAATIVLSLTVFVVASRRRRPEG
ncbi:MFS transporter [Cohnella sp. CBP 2801]|uniref:MFS transporter n=2 Tax=Cohnella zeiphila TaxID=2761120 RepID=A0A7X0SIG2_9BACL|nr:MFS transporter [Cohnella zeiphila]